VSKGKRFQAMSWEVFDEHRDVILAGIRALDANPLSRKRNRLLEVCEEGGDHLVAEVLYTTHGAVVVYRSRGRVKRQGRTGMFTQASRGSANLLVDPLTGDPDQRFHLVGHTHQDLGVCGRDLTAWIDSGNKRVVLNAPTPDLRPPSDTAKMALWLAEHVGDIARHPEAGELFRYVDKLYDDIADTLSNETNE
jgi:hypothetical protein